MFIAVLCIQDMPPAGFVQQYVKHFTLRRVVSVVLIHMHAAGLPRRGRVNTEMMNGYYLFYIPCRLLQECQWKIRRIQLPVLITKLRPRPTYLRIRPYLGCLMLPTCNRSQQDKTRAEYLFPTSLPISRDMPPSLRWEPF